MKKSTKVISLSLSGLLVIGLLLSTAIGAMAADETLTGLLAGTATAWTVNGEPVVVDAGTVCVNVTPCSSLAAGMLVTVVKDDETNLASNITVLDQVANLTATGVVASFAPNLLTLVGGAEYLIGTYTTLPSLGVAEGKMVNVTYKPAAATGATKNLAMAIELVNSTVSQTFEGTIIAIGEGKRTLTIQDDQGNAYGFTLSEAVTTLDFGMGDRVAITYIIVDGSFVATGVQLVESAVPVKTESERCTNDKSNHPALAKLAAKIFAKLPEDSGYASVEVLQADLVDYFCKGFGVGEIKLAFRHASGSQYTAQMLLSMRAEGSGWGQLKKLAKAEPKIIEESTTEESTTIEPGAPQNGQGKSNKPDKAPKSGKPDSPGKSGQHGKP